VTLKLYALLGVVLIVGVIVLVALQTDGIQGTPPESMEQTPPVSPGTEAPSKENASASVKETIGHLREVVSQNPNDAAALLELASLLQNAHAPGEAVLFYARGLRIDSTNIDARIDYSLCLFELGRAPEALTQNREVVRLDPGNPKGLYNIGAIHANGGRRDSAEFYWNRLVKLHPEHEMAKQARESLGRLHEISAMQ
jgi:tetratricopeptide (TPR) repeat protein